MWLARNQSIINGIYIVYDELLMKPNKKKSLRDDQNQENTSSSHANEPLHMCEFLWMRVPLCAFYWQGPQYGMSICAHVNEPAVSRGIVSVY